MIKKLIIVLGVCFLSIYSYSWENPLLTKSEIRDERVVTSRNVITNMLDAISRTNTLKYTFKAQERIDGKEFHTELEVKMLVEPMKLYINTLSEPNKGVEILYVTGQHDNKAFVNPGKWLPNLKLSPYGSRMRKNQHNTILNSGFGMLYDILRDAIARADKQRPGEFETFFEYQGEVTWQGRACYKIMIEDPEFRYVDYVVKEGEDVTKIAKRNLICGYLVLEKNDIKDFGKVEAGDQIKIPSSYAKKTILYIDKQNLMPVVQIMYDETGVFERYEFHNLKVNPSISDSEFTKDYEEYRF